MYLNLIKTKILFFLRCLISCCITIPCKHWETVTWNWGYELRQMEHSSFMNMIQTARFHIRLCTVKTNVWNYKQQLRAYLLIHTTCSLEEHQLLHSWMFCLGQGNQVQNCEDELETWSFHYEMHQKTAYHQVLAVHQQAPPDKGQLTLAHVLH